MEQTDLTTRDYVAIIRRRLPVVVLLCIIGAAAGVAIAKLRHPTYRASAAVAVNLQNVPNGIAGIQAPNLINPDRYTATLARVAASPTVAQMAIARARLAGISPDQLLNESSVAADVNSNYIKFTVTTSSASRSELLADSYGLAFLHYNASQSINQINALLKTVRGELRATAAQLLAARGNSAALRPALQQQYNALLTQEAQLKTLGTYQTSQSLFLTTPALSATTVQPTPTVAGVAGLAGGLLVGILLGFALEGADSRVRSIELVSQSTGLRLLGEAPKHRRRRGRPAVVCLGGVSSSPEVDAFYALALRLDLAINSAGAQTIALTSSIDREGKSTVAANVAVALASLGQRVVLLELDLRKPSLASLFHAQQGPGAAELAAGTHELEDVVQRIPLQPDSADTQNGRAAGNQLLLITAGNAGPDPAVLLGGSALENMLRNAMRMADRVIVDTPPVLATSDTIAVLRAIDATIVIARLGHVKRAMLGETRRLLDQEPTQKLGIVASDVKLNHIYPGGYRYAPSPPVAEKV